MPSSTDHPGDLALLTLTCLAFKSVTACAPHIALTALTTVELLDFLSEVKEAQAVLEALNHSLDGHARLRIADAVHNKEAAELEGFQSQPQTPAVPCHATQLPHSQSAS